MAGWQVLVAGAGYTGERLLAALPRGTAIGLRRRRADADGPPILEADLDAGVPTLPPARVIVYTIPPPREGDDDPRLARFLDAIEATPDRVVYFSTSGVYGDREGDSVDESTPPAPATDRARRRLAAERRLETWCAQHRSEPTILRVPGIYGPDRLGTAQRAAGKPVLCEADAGPGNRIHVDDLVACALAAADPARPAGIYNVGDGDDRSATWFAQEVARQTGLPPPPEIPREEAERTFSRMRLSFLAESRRLDVTRMREALGVSPRYHDPAEGIRASLAKERRRGRGR